MSTYIPPKWIVKNVIAQNDYTLLLTFITGEQKIFDMKPFLDYPIFRPLKNKGLFLQAHIEGPSVAWTEQIDMDPEELYEDSVPFQQLESTAC